MTMPAEMPTAPTAQALAPAGPAIVGVRALKDLGDDTDFTSAYKAGQIGFHADERIPLQAPDGSFGTIGADELAQAVDAGAKIVHPDAVHHAEIEAKYGDGAGNTALAGVAGAGRGVSVGVSDPLTLAAAYAFGGQKSEEEMRERLESLKELHPWASGIGEAAGMVAPAFLTGGASAGLEGAEALSVGAKAARLGEAAADAGKLARVAEPAVGSTVGRGILDAIAAPNAAIGKLGKAAGNLAKGVVGSGAENAVLRAAQDTIAHAAGAAAEGVAYSQGQQLSEQMLSPDPNLTADKWFADTAHSAALAGLIGGGLGLAGEAGGAALNKVRAKASPYLRSKAEEEAFRVLNGRVKFTKEAERIPGGPNAVGRDLLDRVSLSATDTTESLLPKIEAVKAQDFDRIEQSFAHVADDTASLKSVLDPLEARAREFDKREGYEGAAKTIRDRIESIRRRYTPGGAALEDEIAAIRKPALPKEPAQVNPALRTNEQRYALDLADTGGGAAERAEDMAGTLAHEQAPIKIDMTRPGHIGDGVLIDQAMREGTHIGEPPIGMRLDPAATEKAQTARIDANRKVRLEDYADSLAEREQKIAKIQAAHDARVAAIDPAKIRVRLGDLLDQRRSFEGTIDWQRDGNVITKGKRAFGRALEDVIVEHGEKAAAGKGLAGWGKEYAQAKLDWRRMKVAADAATDAISRSESNAAHSLTDKMVGAAGMIGGLLTHGIGGAIVGHGAQYLSTQVRKRANAALAVTFDKVSALQSLARSTDAVDARMNKAVRGFLKRAGGEEGFSTAKTVAGKAAPTESPREEYERRVTAVQAATKANLDHGPISSAIAKHAPMTADAIARRAASTTAWLAAQIPEPPKWGTQAPSSQAVHVFNTQAKAVDDPGGTLERGLTQGGLTKTQVDAIQATSPALLDDLKQRIDAQMQQTLLTSKQPVPYGVRRDLALLFDIDAAWSMTPDGIEQLQGAAQSSAQAQDQQNAGPAGRGGGKHGAVKTPAAQGLQTPGERREGGQIR